MFNEVKNPRQLKDHILMRLGAPIINIEVTEAQIFDCIQRSLELYGEYHYNGLNRAYVAIKVDTDDKYINGIFDLSEYNIFAVTNIIRQSASSILTMDGSATYPWVSDFILGLAGGGAGCSCSSMYGPWGYGADLSYYTTLMQYWDILQKTLNPELDYWFNDDTGQLQINGNFKSGDVIVLEAWIKSFVDVDDAIGGDYYGENISYTPSEIYNNPKLGIPSILPKGGYSQGAFNNRWVKDYATALVKETNGQILAKHQGLQLPGGTTVDGIRLIEEARIEKERLREELDSLEAPPGILMG